MREERLVLGCAWHIRARWLAFALLVCLLHAWSLAANRKAQAGGRAKIPSAQEVDAKTAPGTAGDENQQAEAELKTGTNLTRQGLFAEAIPHLLKARGRVANEYAAGFNLALCYLGSREFKRAVDVLDSLRQGGHANADVENLLAQAYVGEGEPQRAFAAFERASALTPSHEKLYLFVADACMDSRDYDLGFKVVELGLTKLPESARLHYERGVFLSLLGDFDRARDDFRAVGRLQPGSEIAYLASAHQELFAGDPVGAARVAREGVSKGYDNPILLTILGEALIRSGLAPGDPEFAEARTALERAVSERPRDANAQTSLGRLYLMAERPADAIARLEKARELDPQNPSVYSSLAKAYRRHGDLQQAQDALATLSKLNQAQADKIGSAPGDRKASYGGENRDPASPP
jgi:predicted Zn-dependent protease